GLGGRSGGSGHGNGFNNLVQYQICGRNGHLASNCYHQYDNQFQSHNSNGGGSAASRKTNPFQAMIASPQIIVDPARYANFGASIHITTDIQNFVTIEQINNCSLPISCNSNSKKVNRNRNNERDKRNSNSKKGSRNNNSEKSSSNSNNKR
ncbi:hypothetical protein PanWU01x14_292410, partial [Parasponia andersonii]